MPHGQPYGPQKSLASPLMLDTSDVTLVASPAVSSLEGSPLPQSPLGFRDAQEVGSLSSEIHHDYHVYRWWPYFILPDPYFLYITLFPTVRGFRSKTYLQKFLAIIAVPAVFCLTVTLPVVDNETPEPDGEIKLPPSPSSPTTIISSILEESDIVRPLSHDSDGPLVPRVWNRWLTGVQCICAPLFIAFIFFRIFPD